jgi:sterol 3beta-glucosyltransferase
VATAIEAIYRDLEYARSLIKRPGLSNQHSEEGSTSRIPRTSHSPRSSHLCDPRHARNSSESTHHDGGATSDWSVISDQED